MLALTATASKQRRKKIQKLLGMQACKDIVDNPDRGNIKLHVQHVKSDAPLTETFSWIVSLLKTDTVKCPRLLIFCKSIDDCSKIYFVCKQYISKDLMQHVDMYHSQTPDKTKGRIREDMATTDGQVRVLVCTNAAGMGVNYAGVNNVINFGPPQEMDTLLQQQGRAGRTGDQAHHLMIYNNRQLRNVTVEMLQYLHNKENLCRRKMVLKHYNADCDDSRIIHTCCDVCEQECSCGSADCKTCVSVVHTVKETEELASDEEEAESRHPTPEQSQALIASLQQYQRQLNADTKTASLTTAPEVTHGFTQTVIDNIVDKCLDMGSPDDYLAQCGLWSYDQAKTVYVIVSSILEIDSDTMESMSDTDYTAQDD